MATTLRILLLPMFLGLTLLASGCGNAITADVVGMTAVSVDDQGRPIIVVAVCSDHVDQVEVVGDRTGLSDSEPNPDLGSWTSTDPQTGTFSIEVAKPGADWTPSGPIGLEGDRQYIVSASRSDADVETRQVNFRGSELASLKPAQVIVLDDQVWSRTKFDAQACS